MTDSNATERLRELLDERGVEYFDGTSGTYWDEYDRFAYRFSAEELSDGSLRVVLYGITPEQAVAATLGADDGSRWFELFGTPERAANILALGCMGAEENVCDSCVFRECDGKLRRCESIHSIATQMFEWLRGKAVKR